MSRALVRGTWAALVTAGVLLAAAPAAAQVAGQPVVPIEGSPTSDAPEFEGTRAVKDSGGSLKEAFAAVHAELAPRYAGFPIFEHTMPFNVQRVWDELEGIEHARIWTAERDREVWDALQD